MDIPSSLESELDVWSNWLKKQPVNDPNYQEASALIAEAKGHLAKVRAHPLGSIEDDPAGERALSLLLGTRPPVLVKGQEIIGWHQYEDLDPRWVSSLVHSLSSRKVPFVASPPDVIRINDNARFCLAGDWGTGTDSSKAIMRVMDDLAPDYTVHLGDVYYAGTPDQELRRFVDPWKAGTAGAFALNSNHEMYSGGYGYYKVALTNSKFALQAGCSYFALMNSDWLIVGLDSAYWASAPLYAEGRLDAGQVGWLTKVVEGNRRADGARRKLVIFTHHHPMDFNGKKKALWNDVVTALKGDAPDYWYWGHIHAAAVMNPVREGGTQCRGRCVGHGGVPYLPEKKTQEMEWTEPGVTHDPVLRCNRGLNGFVELSFAGANLSERFVDEYGKQSYPPR